MGNLYYKIWVDAINFERTKHGHIRNWKTYTLLPISVLQGLNLAVLYFLFGLIMGKFPRILLVFDIFPGEQIDAFLSGFLTLIFPFLIINYFLIFHQKKYEALLTKYKYYNGRIYRTTPHL